MAKAEKFHREASLDVYSMLNEMINQNHKEFNKTEILIQMKHGGWNSKGKTVFGKFKVLADDLRTSMEKDVILQLNAEMWTRMTDPQKKYVLDHALFSLDTKQSKHGVTLYATDGRPLLKTVPPDIEAYVEVIRRHGTITEDVKRLARAIKEVNPGQLTIDDAGTAQDPPAPPHEGLTVVVGADGVVEGVEDKNQLTLEEAAAAAENDPMHGVGNDLPFTEPEDDEPETGDSDNGDYDENEFDAPENDEELE
ncbi:hypothetical protein BK133_10900 [Paenibacillus sp. FSL H8-0548]|uniref:putative metallopeptidase n=1 Tax=Paenibacillus sp. FSL H8-0548 TaxID=1920422 RepID=UPI00096D3480|nr:putative metallopeptidase [Paenibacillus sp. FSL H8-0548]OMF35212.1 hypothetical protein BK133_10900 [Paenibacillus sp. FSL H8-0548]